MKKPNFSGFLGFLKKTKKPRFFKMGLDSPGFTTFCYRTYQNWLCHRLGFFIIIYRLPVLQKMQLIITHRCLKLLVQFENGVQDTAGDIQRTSALIGSILRCVQCFLLDAYLQTPETEIDPPNAVRMTGSG